MAQRLLKVDVGEIKSIRTENREGFTFEKTVKVLSMSDDPNLKPCLDVGDALYQLSNAILYLSRQEMEKFSFFIPVDEGEN